MQRVLVADRCPDTTASLGTLLRLWGYEPCTAADGPATLDALRRHRPDVVLTDLALPELDGCEVARRLRAEGAPVELLVAITSHACDADRRRAYEAGFDLFLAKPVDPRILRQLLAQIDGKEAGNRQRPHPGTGAGACPGRGALVTEFAQTRDRPPVAQ